MFTKKLIKSVADRCSNTKCIEGLLIALNERLEQREMMNVLYAVLCSPEQYDKEFSTENLCFCDEKIISYIKNEERHPDIDIINIHIVSTNVLLNQVIVEYDYHPCYYYTNPECTGDYSCSKTEEYKYNKIKEDKTWTGVVTINYEKVNITK